MRINHTSLLFLLSLVSCTAANLEAEKIKVDNPLKPDRTSTFQEFGAVIEGGYTKTVLDEQSLKVSWEYEDEVLITDGQGHWAIYSPKKVEGVALAQEATLCRVGGDTLITTQQNPSISYKAYYPAYLFNTADSSAYLPAIQTFVDPGKFGPVPMIAQGAGTLEFKNLCSMLKFEYKPSATIIVKRIELSALQPLSGEGKVSFDPLGIQLAGDPKENTLTYDYMMTGFTYKKDRVKTLNVFVPAGSYDSLKVNIVYFNSSTDTLMRNIEATMQYRIKAERGKEYDIDINNPEGREKNLSKYGTANCYPIASGEEFRFTPRKGCSDERVGDIDTVKVIWSTDNTEVAPPDEEYFITNLRYDADEDVVKFSIPKGQTRYGNVLIGAYDASDQVLWSWHIWILKDNIMDLVFDNVNNIYAMDRYLGQLSGKYSKTQSPCLSGSILYQWGRKDPFPGYTTYISSRPKVVVQGTSTAKAAGPVSPEVSIANPCTFYTSTGNWSTEDSLWTAEKTIYDPCPAGYRVLDRQILESEPTWTILNNAGPTSSQYYRYSSYGDYIFPYTCFYKGTDYSMSVNGSTYLWTMEHTADQATYFYFSGKTISKTPIQTWAKSYGCGVRCQKMPTEED